MGGAWGLSLVVGDRAEDDREDLAGMLRSLRTNYARAFTEAKMAKDRQRALQQENDLLKRRLASVEAQSLTSRVVVRSALVEDGRLCAF